jgi:hypothetical protein
MDISVDISKRPDTSISSANKSGAAHVLPDFARASTDTPAKLTSAASLCIVPCRVVHLHPGNTVPRVFVTATGTRPDSGMVPGHPEPTARHGDHCDQTQVGAKDACPMDYEPPRDTAAKTYKWFKPFEFCCRGKDTVREPSPVQQFTATATATATATTTTTDACMGATAACDNSQDPFQYFLGDLAGAAALPDYLTQTEVRTVPSHGSVEEAVQGPPSYFSAIQTWCVKHPSEQAHICGAEAAAPAGSTRDTVTGAGARATRAQASTRTAVAEECSDTGGRNTCPVPRLRSRSTKQPVHQTRHALLGHTPQVPSSRARTGGTRARRGARNLPASHRPTAAASGARTPSTATATSDSISSDSTAGGCGTRACTSRHPPNPSPTARRQTTPSAAKKSRGTKRACRKVLIPDSPKSSPAAAFNAATAIATTPPKAQRGSECGLTGRDKKLPPAPAVKGSRYCWPASVAGVFACLQPQHELPWV